MMEKRFSGKHTIILAGDTLAVMTHRDEGNEVHRGGLYRIKKKSTHFEGGQW